MDIIQIAEQLESLKKSVKELSILNKKILLKDKEAIYFVHVNSIIRCEAYGAYTRFILIENKTIVVSSTLKDFEELLQEVGFVRTHHSHIINLSKITRYNRQDGGFLVMENDDIIPVSKRKKSALATIIEKIREI